MSLLDEIAALTTNADIQLKVNIDTAQPQLITEPAELFHVPLVALCLLVIAHQRRGDFDTSEMGRAASAVLSQMCFKENTPVKRFEWSVTFRKRCAEALEFLELAEFARVGEHPPRQIEVTDAGKKFIDKALRSTKDLGALTRGLVRTHSQVMARGLQLL